jgi:hypothetical protein
VLAVESELVDPLVESSTDVPWVVSDVLELVEDALPDVEGPVVSAVVSPELASDATSSPG